MNKTILIIIVVVILAGVGYYFMNSNSKTKPTTQTEHTLEDNTKMEGEAMKAEATTAPSEDVAMKKDSDSTVKEFTVEGKNFAFSPATIEVNKGDKVKIIFKNTGGMHDWVIDELNVKAKQIKSDEQETIEFTASEAGTFEYYCSVGNHRAMGMVGKLIVK